MKKYFNVKESLQHAIGVYFLYLGFAFVTSGFFIMQYSSGCFLSFINIVVNVNLLNTLSIALFISGGVFALLGCVCSLMSLSINKKGE